MASSTAVVGAAAAAARRRREVIALFVSHRAIAPGSAVEFEPASRSQQRFFERLREDGVIRSALAGYWIDEVRLAAWQAKRRRRIGFVVGGLVAGLAAGLGLSRLGD